MKPQPSPPAARCPVPAKLPEPVCVVATWPNPHGKHFQSLIRTHRRPSKAQLRAVQGLLTNPPEDLGLRIAREIFALPSDCPAASLHRPGLELIGNAALTALGLHRKPGQHAGEKGKR